MDEQVTTTATSANSRGLVPRTGRRLVDFAIRFATTMGLAMKHVTHGGGEKRQIIGPRLDFNPRAQDYWLDPQLLHTNGLGMTRPDRFAGGPFQKALLLAGVGVCGVMSYGVVPSR
jgi:hypothetical protein